MATVNFQVPMDKKLRDSAAKEAKAQGFSSLQEYFRVFATMLTQNKVSIDLKTSGRLTSKAQKRYAKMEKDFAEGKNIESFDSVEDLMKDLAS